MKLHRLNQLSEELKQQTITSLFAADPLRANKLCANSQRLSIDYSKSLLTEQVLAAFQQHFNELDLQPWITRLFDGELINNTERRAAHHTRLRTDQPDPLVEHALASCYQLCDDILSSKKTGASGERFTDVVNIGIGGSDLGPRLASDVLKNKQAGINAYFVSNLDSAEINKTLAKLKPETTLFIVASKSFTTDETLTNAVHARRWLASSIVGENSGQHFIAITSADSNAIEFGIAPEAILPMWDWVGGRYSLWSCIGLSTMLCAGKQAFQQLLAGARAMDQHFQQTAQQDNLPIILAIIEIWYVNFIGAHSHAVIPYSYALRKLPSYLQQLCMESNGKSVKRDGSPVDAATNPIVWGTAGTDGQHSYHQLLHQGTETVTVDFLLPLSTGNNCPAAHQKLVANCLAQSRVLMTGQSLTEAEQQMRDVGYSEADITALAPHKVMHGNNPSTIVSFDQLDAFTLGELLALYEHKTFVCSVFWQINPFDQWGVELGKKIGKQVNEAMLGDSEALAGLDSSTLALISKYQQSNQRR
jgi:glucose-6-phosphate isomerase